MVKVLYALIVVPLLVIAGIVLKKIFVHQPMGPLSIFAIFSLLCLSCLTFVTLIFYRQKKWHVVENVWLFAVSSILSYMMIDLVAGYLFIKPLSPPLVADEYVHHKMKPNTFSRFKTNDYDYIQRVNNIGLRGRDVDVVKGQNIYRILMLGDSFTMGKGVQDDETFSFVLEKSLKSKKLKIKGKTVQILNAGVNSYAPIISFLQLKKQLWQLEPDLVVLNLDMSDLMQELAYRKAASYGDNGEIIGVSGANPMTWLWFLGSLPPKEDENKESKIRSTAITLEIRRWINRHLFITRLLYLYIDALSKESEEITIDNTVTLRYGNLLKHTLAEDESDRKEQWEQLFDSIKNLKKYCDDRGIDFLLTIYPWGHQVNDREWDSGRKDFIPANSHISDRSIYTIHNMAEKNNVKVLNVFRSFRSYNDTAPLYFNHDMHWTPRGHQLMAEEFEQFLIRR